jgi:hypothetical protein
VFLLRRLRLVLLALGAASGLVWGGAYSLFTDAAAAQSNFSAGTVDLTVNNEVDDDYAFTTLDMNAMKPGDVRYAALTVANAGTLPFTYAMATSATNTDGKNLRDQLTVEVRLVANTAACNATGFTASGTTLTPSGALSGAAIAGRSLAASASEVACFKVTLPSSAGDAYQGATTSATFTLSAS